MSEADRALRASERREAVRALNSRGDAAGALDDPMLLHGWYIQGPMQMTSRVAALALTVPEAEAWLSRARAEGWIAEAPVGGLELTSAGRRLAGMASPGDTDTR